MVFLYDTRIHKYGVKPYITIMWPNIVLYFDQNVLPKSVSFHILMPDLINQLIASNVW